MVAQLTDKELMINFYLSQGLLFLISVVAILFLFESFNVFFSLFIWNDLRILTVGATIGIGLAFTDLFLQRIFPYQYYDDGGINERLFINRGVFRIIWMNLIVAVCEELLFRGVLQTHIGLIAASSIFVIVHIRYLFNKYLLLNVIVVSFFIGFIYEWTDNLAVTMMLHFANNCLLGLVIYFRHSETNTNI